MSFPPTPEQQAAIDAFVAGQDLVLSAFAGTGKTTTLRFMADAAPQRKGLYLAYNKAIQMDADGSFPSNVECRTAHSVAYGWMVRQPNGKQILNKIRNNKNVPSWTAAKILRIPAQGFQAREGSMPQRGVASIVMQTIENFCRSSDREIGERHVPREFDDFDTQAEFRTFVAGFARKAWADVISPSGLLKFSMNVYLKLYVLSNPDLSRYDFILFDEAQDANPCIAQIVNAQRGRCQIVMVGDAHQAIYGWNGAIDAMSTFEADAHLKITQSFRFGPAVAEQANRFLALLGETDQIKGCAPWESTVGPLSAPDAILCRTNAEAVAQAMDAQQAGQTVALVGGTKEIARFVRAAEKLMGGGKTEHEDLIIFESWADVQAFSQETEGRDLRVMVKLIENYGAATILGVCDSSVEEADADVVISTVHKAKGREWDSVRIANDFKAPEDGGDPRTDEMMLMYVAVTRAKRVLDCLSLSWVGATV